MTPPKPSQEIKYKDLTLDPNIKIGVDKQGNPIYSGLIIKAYLQLKEKQHVCRCT